MPPSRAICFFRGTSRDCKAVISWLLKKGGFCMPWHSIPRGTSSLWCPLLSSFPPWHTLAVWDLGILEAKMGLQKFSQAGLLESRIALKPNICWHSHPVKDYTALLPNPEWKQMEWQMTLIGWCFIQASCHSFTPLPGLNKSQRQIRPIPTSYQVSPTFQRLMKSAA